MSAFVRTINCSPRLAGPVLTGIDLTERAVESCAASLRGVTLKSKLRVANAERLPFPDRVLRPREVLGASFHHTPDTPRAVREAWRVLRPGP